MSNIEPTPFGEKYLLVEHIATGGMAEVYRSQYSGIEGFAKELVVKRLRPEFGERADVVQMFLDEARVAATLTHNNVVHTYDLGEVEGEYFIAMELLKGEELVAVLRRASQHGVGIPLEITLAIALQSLEGLFYVHSKLDDTGQPLGLVHRDINPTNIHVGYDGVCKIVDFGIAATRATVLADDRPGQFAGKLSYMAPEQVRGEDLDDRADIFALGVVLYEMCLGRRLFRGPGEEVRRRILSGDVPAPTFADPDFPPELEAVLMKALEVDPAERYQNADHMFRDLEEYVTSSGMACTARRISAFMSELFGMGAPAQINYEDEFSDLADEALDFDRLDALAKANERADAPAWAKGFGARSAPSSAEGGASSDAKPKKRRSLTIGDLSAITDRPPLSGPAATAQPLAKPQIASQAAPAPQKAASVAVAAAPASAARSAEQAPASAQPQAAASTSSAGAPAASASSSGRRQGRGSSSAGSRAASRAGTGRAGEPAAGVSETSPRAPKAGESKITGQQRMTAAKTTSNPTMTGSFGQAMVTKESGGGLGPIIAMIAVIVVGLIAWGLYTVFTQK